MRNFNKNRCVDVKSYLPDMLCEIEEFRAISDTENAELKAVWDELDNVFDDQFITEATEKGIARREVMLGIIPQTTDTLESRRFRLLSLYGDGVPYTRRSLDAQLRSLCGSDNYTLSFSNADFAVTVKIALSASAQIGAVSDMLERVLPYNMQVNVELMYNQWHRFAHLAWNALKIRTWKSIKEETP